MQEKGKKTLEAARVEKGYEQCTIPFLPKRMIVIPFLFMIGLEDA